MGVVRGRRRREGGAAAWVTLEIVHLIVHTSAVSHLVPIKLRIPADVLADLDAVSPPRGRTRFIVAAIRERLDGEPAAQRARKERAESIKEKLGVE